MHTRSRSKSKERATLPVIASAASPNEFMLSDEEAGGSARSATFTGAEEARPSHANASSTLQLDDSVNRVMLTDSFPPPSTVATQVNAVMCVASDSGSTDSQF